MKILILVAAALGVTSAAAGARTLGRPAPWSHAADERVAHAQPAPAWTMPVDNSRPAFAAHVSANGQGTY